ncbi:PhnE/PtxC family ABC transporter permease [Desulfopila aestuarii]|uniref:Phosphonate transport system permease protein n=1 Tax=Desulfopila aestuarii DSM 18488 TaxID=1121416 RepID=A0A1M7XVH5_9BACT|nr:ABC transporter permease [Desulfopila aestuarii]SHO42582.1 phosphonate transport system permease protein [Desulfopila aestuarii DSM 18488]
MLRTSLWFVFIAVGALFVANISITTLEPWGELQKLGLGLLTPDFLSLPGFWQALINTVSFALIGISLAIVFGWLLSLFFSLTPVRLFCGFIRAIHELFWAFIFMPIIGLNSLCGILAIAIPYAGVFAKVYAEIRQESDQRPAEALAPNTSRVSGFFYTTLPIIYGELKNYTSYRFECALRSSAILGFIGLPTIGYHLETAFREGMYSEAAALLYSFYLLIISIRFWAKPRLLVFACIGAVLLTSWDVSLSSANIIRFFTYDILPWPMRAEGYYTGTQAVTLPFAAIGAWLLEVMKTEALPGIWQTMVLTQIALVCTAVLTLMVFPFASRRFHSAGVTGTTQMLLVILRTTPEYILAYIFLILWGPSMLPAILAMSLHNGGILSSITAGNVNLLQLPFDSSTSRINRYLYEVLPRCYGQFLAFLFYRWEVIMRESAILGILGITTLGYYIDSAISSDHLDTALLLIVVTAMLNMVIDSLSQFLRRSLRISAHLKVELPTS